jgi:hypothetical protein
MQFDVASYLEKRRRYLENRASFPPDQLVNYAGQWIAWSPDGARIIAHSGDSRSLDDLIRAAGEDPEECLVEGIPDEDSVIGGVELGLEICVRRGNPAGSGRLRGL